MGFAKHAMLKQEKYSRIPNENQIRKEQLIANKGGL